MAGERGVGEQPAADVHEDDARARLIAARLRLTAALPPPPQRPREPPAPVTGAAPDGAAPTLRRTLRRLLAARRP